MKNRRLIGKLGHPAAASKRVYDWHLGLGVHCLHLMCNLDTVVTVYVFCVDETSLLPKIIKKISTSGNIVEAAET